jgi:predicted DNA-binding transcriptional regulator AlpA
MEIAPLTAFGPKQRSYIMQRLHRIIRLRDLPDYVGLQRTAIAELIEAGKFPKPIPLSDTGRAVGWLEHELISWQQERLAARERKEAGDA